MNKTAIKNFAVWARNKLISEVKYKAGLLGITDKGIAEPLPQSTDDLQFFDIGTKQPAQLKGKTAIEQRQSLVTAIKSKSLKYCDAYEAVMEEVAYTWFNRLIAIRFMEVNDYLPSRVRVLSSENPAKAEPDFVTKPFDTDLEFTDAELDLIDDFKDRNKSEELFKFLFIKQCNKLNEILPELFEKTNDYTELLLNVSFTDKDGVVWHLVHDIDEDDFNVEKEGQVEIIGWLYQYYNTEPKDKVFARPSGQKIRKEDVPAATQLFTPDWIVRYMVENSLGRVYSSKLKAQSSKSIGELEKEVADKMGWKYFLPQAEQSPEVEAEMLNSFKLEALSFELTKFLDPCMGSGHILVYAFEVFMDIYRSLGYTERDAAQRIVEKNLYGLELDDRAAQLAYFAVMMKARSYDRRFLTRGIRPNLCSIQESNNLNYDYLALFGDLLPLAIKLCDEFKDAKEYGSILNLKITADEIAQLESKYNEIINEVYDNMFDIARQAGLRTLFAPLLKQAKIMVKKYEVVCTNPPYMGGSGMSAKLSEFVKKNYPDSKADLFSCFIEKAYQYAKPSGYTSLITMESWMFLSSFEKLRSKINTSKTIINMVHMPYLGKGGTSLGINFGTAAVITKNSRISNYVAQYEYTVYYETDDNGVPFVFPTINERWKTAKQEDFSKIPGSPVAYWVSDRFRNAFQIGDLLGSLIPVKKGMDTGNNDYFLKYWFEVSVCTIDYTNHLRKWVPYDKGGDYRKWYGNNEYVLNWECDGIELKNSKANLRSKHLYFIPSITWSALSASNTSFRYSKYKGAFDSAGSSMFPNRDRLFFFLGLMNTKVVQYYLNIINPTLNYGAGSMAQVPVIIPEAEKVLSSINTFVEENIYWSESDWDSFETSWDFKKHPFLAQSLKLKAQSGVSATLISEYYKAWEQECEQRFNQLKANEEELNRIFIDIYGLQDELTPDVEDKDVTVRKADLKRDVKSFISYAVGCMFGRYSLDTEGLVYAGGEWDSLKYKTFIPDSDNCIQITDTSYFEDDIVSRFVEFVKTVYGKDTLEENLDFIANALGNKGNTSREVIRNYFLNDFFKDHCKIYQKRPIYWLFDSGKQNGFKALVYMHRWNADTIGNVRVEYLHRIQRVYEREIEREQDTIDNSNNSRDKAAAAKRKEKLVKQLKETKDYDAMIAHLALSRIDIDLDDGVKVNYEKVQTGQDGKKLQVLGKI